MIPWWVLGALAFGCAYGVWLAIYPEIGLRLVRLHWRWWFGLESMTPPPEIPRGTGLVLAVLCGLVALFGTMAHVLRR